MISQEGYEKLIKMSRKSNYITRNLLDYLHCEKYFKFTGIDLSRQTNKNMPQKINFVGKLQEDGATIFFVS